MVYNVTAKRWEHGWELHIDGCCVTQAATLAEAEDMVRDYLACDGVGQTDPIADVVVSSTGDDGATQPTAVTPR